MRLYTYCSYKFSPVGYQLGFLDYSLDSNGQQSGELCTDRGQMEKFISSALRDERIDYICCGKLPCKECHVILLKNMKVEEDDFWIDINLAFVFQEEEKNLFKRMMSWLKLHKNYNTTKEYFEDKCNREDKQKELSKHLRKLIVADSQNTETGIKVSVDELNQFIKDLRNCSPNTEAPDPEKLYIIRMNEPAPLEGQEKGRKPFKFEELYPSEEYHGELYFELKSVRGYYICREKKKMMITLPIIMLCLKIIEILLIATILLVMLVR